MPVPLTREVASSLRLPWSSLLSREELLRHVERFPELSWHVPGTSAYLVAGPWRHREEIVEVFETRGELQRPALWEALHSRPSRPPALVLVDVPEYRVAGEFYKAVGVRALEEVLILRSGVLPGPPAPRPLDVQMVRGRSPSDLIALDHAAFPWLWCNAPAEWEEYLATPGVRVGLGVDGGEPVGYVGYTELAGWGHIDRLAVHPERQGRGYGAALLSWTLGSLHAAGARYVQLSTQGTNERSQRLYARYGFKPTRGAHRLYGAWTGAGDPEVTGGGG